MKERTSTCIEVETLKEAEDYCKESKKRPDIIIISGAAFMGYSQDSDITYDFYFKNHHLFFSVNGGNYADDELNFKAHTYNFDKYSKIDWIKLQ